MNDKLVPTRKQSKLDQFITLLKSYGQQPTLLGDTVIEIHLAEGVTREQIDVESLIYVLRTPAIGLGDEFNIGFRQRT